MLSNADLNYEQCYSTSGERKTVQGKNSDVHKGMKSHRNVKHVCKYMTYLLDF